MKAFLSLPPRLRLYIASVIFVGVALAASRAATPADPEAAALLPLLLVWMVVCSLFRFNLAIPGGYMTLGTAAVSLAQIQLGTREAMLVAGVGAVVSYYAVRAGTPSAKGRPAPLYQPLFNLCNCLVAAALGGLAYEWVLRYAESDNGNDALAVAPAIFAWVPPYFAVNTAGVAQAIALRTNQPFARVWRENFLWTAAGYVACALLSVGVMIATVFNQLWSLLFIAPVFLVYRSWRSQIDGLQAARQYQTLVERARDGVVILRNSLLVYANQSFAQMLGMKPEEVVGREYTSLLPDNEAPASSLLGEGDAVMVAQTLLRADGSRIEVELSTSFVAYQGHECLQALVRDVSERHEMQRQAAQTEKLRAVGQMASGVAHDFNNALMAVLGNISLARMALPVECGAGHGRTDERLIAAEQAAMDAGATVRRLQAFSRPALGGKETLDLHEIAREVLLMTRPVWRDTPRAAGREVRTEVTGDRAVFVHGDASELREALTNLVYNAVHAMPNGGLLRMSVRREAEWAALAVSDTGTGIPPDVMPHLFEPFYTTKGAAGSGLGLFVTYGLVTQHEGEIKAQSAPGHGTTFTLRFPLVSEAGEAPAAPEPVPHTAARVLVVDDEQVVRDVVSTMLRNAGARVEEAEGGQAALAALERETFDVVITDLSMPGMSGMDLARELRVRHPHLPVVLLTGWAESTEVVAANAGLVASVLTKPVSMRQLIHHVTRAVES